MVFMTSLTTAFVILGSMGLRLISRGRGVVAFSLVFILEGLILKLLVGVLLVFFRQQAMAFQALGIDFPNIEG